MSVRDLQTHAWFEYHPRTSSAGRIYQSSQSETIDGLEAGVFDICHVEERIRNLQLSSLELLVDTSTLGGRVEAKKLKDPSGDGKELC